MELVWNKLLRASYARIHKRIWEMIVLFEYCSGYNADLSSLWSLLAVVWRLAGLTWTLDIWETRRPVGFCTIILTYVTIWNIDAMIVRVYMILNAFFARTQEASISAGNEWHGMGVSCTHHFSDRFFVHFVWVGICMD